jgi:hypothetical protein
VTDAAEKRLLSHIKHILHAKNDIVRDYFHNYLDTGSITSTIGPLSPGALGEIRTPDPQIRRPSEHKQNNLAKYLYLFNSPCTPLTLLGGVAATCVSRPHWAAPGPVQIASAARHIRDRFRLNGLPDQRADACRQRHC